MMIAEVVVLLYVHIVLLYTRTITSPLMTGEFLVVSPLVYTHYYIPLMTGEFLVVCNANGGIPRWFLFREVPRESSVEIFLYNAC